MSAELATVPENPVAAMMAGVIEKGVTADNVMALERLCDLYERMQNKDAEKQFVASFAKLQGEMPVIVATSEIPKRGKYERFEDVMRVVGPLLTQNGFAVSFAQAADAERITVTCHLLHIAGHSTETKFAVRVGGNSDSTTQADCKASTTAKRNALLQALNIVIRQDVYQDEDGPGNVGSPITQAEADELRDRVHELGSSVAEFLQYADASSFETIQTGMLATLNAALTVKEKAKAAKGGAR